MGAWALSDGNGDAGGDSAGAAWGADWGAGATACPPESTGSGDGWAVDAGGDKSANNPLKATLLMP